MIKFPFNSTRNRFGISCLIRSRYAIKQNKQINTDDILRCVTRWPKSLKILTKYLMTPKHAPPVRRYKSELW